MDTNKTTQERNINESNPFDAKILSSCYVSFLFGSGANGALLPQMDGLIKTKSFISAHLGEQAAKDGIEKSMNLFSDERTKKECEQIFKEELEKSSAIDCLNPAFADFKSLLSAVANLIRISENRTPGAKQINLYSLNYDSVIETAATSLGLPINVVTPSDIEYKKDFENIVCYRFDWQKFIPVFLLSKLHGDFSCMVFPGSDKFKMALAKSHFELLFEMKEKLKRPNSVLIVIGYSGNDEEINGIIESGINSGLTVYWFKYKSTDFVPQVLSPVIVIENPDAKNTTSVCATLLQEICQN
jgi:hypothetical protein